jgi:tetrahydromethanopterin S-methyltransferase subunit B
MNWKQGMIAAVVISFIFVFFSPITQFIIHEIISPNFLKNSIDFTVSQKKLTLTEAKEYTTLTSSIWKNISDGLSFGVVIGAIVAYLIQSKPIESTK